jgi:hypothetical protein
LPAVIDALIAAVRAGEQALADAKFTEAKALLPGPEQRKL